MNGLEKLNCGCNVYTTLYQTNACKKDLTERYVNKNRSRHKECDAFGLSLVLWEGNIPCVITMTEVSRAYYVLYYMLLTNASAEIILSVDEYNLLPAII